MPKEKKLVSFYHFQRIYLLSQSVINILRGKKDGLISCRSNSFFSPEPLTRSSVWKAARHVGERSFSFGNLSSDFAFRFPSAEIIYLHTLGAHQLEALAQQVSTWAAPENLLEAFTSADAWIPLLQDSDMVCLEYGLGVGIFKIPQVILMST